MRIGNYVSTYLNIKMYPLDPRDEEIAIEDIAHSLSMLCRANGHIKHFYSVAQHCINCCNEAKARGYDKEVQLACLLHDASEAYMSDVTRPVKKELPHYLVIEEKLQNFIYEKYGVNSQNEETIQRMKQIDDDLLLHEMKHLMDMGVEVNEMRAEANIDCLEIQAVKEKYIRLFNKLVVER